jgi:hypothetical protein
MTVLANRCAPPLDGGGSAEYCYRVPSHVHVCTTGDGSVLLDLKRNKYFGLDSKGTELLATAVCNWPRSSHARSFDCRGLIQAAEQICRSMAESGLLVRDEASLLELEETDVHVDMTAPLVSVGDELEVAAVIRPRHAARLAIAYAWAEYSLRWRPLNLTVEAVRSKKRRRMGLGATWDLHRIAGLIDIFRRLRPFLFAAEARCLVHALTLVRFLSLHDVFPEWVIGVATQPWGAHSWVQWGNHLLDTNPEKVCRYTPILVV